MNNELIVQDSIKPLTETDVRRQVNLIQTIMKNVMKDDMHYGIIPGCKKPALFKPGAEKLMMTFQLYPQYEELSGSVESEDFISYKIECRLVNKNGDIVGTGRGTCNSREKKYKTRTVYENKATDEEKAIGKKEKRDGRNNSVYYVYVIPQDPWDLQNTFYKMACKRANIAAVLSTTAASDIFEQDIEDLPEGTIEPNYQTTDRKPDVDIPQETNTTSETTESVGVSEGATYKTLGKTVVIGDIKAETVKNIHVLASKLWGKDFKEQYKEKLFTWTGKETSKALTQEEGDTVVKLILTEVNKKAKENLAAKRKKQ